MDEITIFSVVRPEPPTAADERAMRSAARERLIAGAVAPAPQTASAPSAARVGRRFTIAGVITAAAAAGVALALTTGGTPAPNPYGKDRTSIVTAAWTVSRDANGLVTFTLGRAFDDPAGLEQALKSEGVTIIVKLNPVRDPKSSGGVETPPWYACAYTKPARGTAVRAGCGSQAAWPDRNQRQ